MHPVLPFRKAAGVELPPCLGKVIKIASYGAALIPADFKEISRTSLIPIILHPLCEGHPHGQSAAAIKANLHDVLTHLYDFNKVCLKS